MSNDVAAYPDDAPANMQRWAEELAFPFPYLHDATQAVAKAYGAVYCRLLRLQRPTATPIPGPARCIGPRSRDPSDARANCSRP